MFTPSVHSYAVRLRQALLLGTTTEKLLQYTQEIEAVGPIPSNYAVRIAARERFARRFLHNVNIYDKRFQCQQKRYSDTFPWIKRYQAFLNTAVNPEKQCTYLTEILSTLPPWFPTPPPSLQLTPKRWRCLQGFIFFGQSTNFGILQQKLDLLQSLSERLGSSIALSAASYNWRVEHRGADKRKIELGDTLCWLPADRLEELVCALAVPDHPIPHLKGLAELEYLSAQLNTPRRSETSGIGIYLNLHQLLEEVLDQYFPEMSTKPAIRWLEHYTTRKMAHYDAARDEIAFSLIFDLPTADPEMVKFILYHELLHRKLGSKYKNGRRFSHTPEFFRLERAYPDSAEWDKKITQYLRS